MKTQCEEGYGTVTFAQLHEIAVRDAHVMRYGRSCVAVSSHLGSGRAGVGLGKMSVCSPEEGLYSCLHADHDKGVLGYAGIQAAA